MTIIIILSLIFLYLAITFCFSRKLALLLNRLTMSYSYNNDGKECVSDSQAAITFILFPIILLMVFLLWLILDGVQNSMKYFGKFLP